MDDINKTILRKITKRLIINKNEDTLFDTGGF